MSTDASNLGVLEQGMQDDGTKALLAEILAELKNLRGQLARPVQVDRQATPQPALAELEDEVFTNLYDWQTHESRLIVCRHLQLYGDQWSQR